MIGFNGRVLLHRLGKLVSELLGNSLECIIRLIDRGTAAGDLTFPPAATNSSAFCALAFDVVKLICRVHSGTACPFRSGLASGNVKPNFGEIKRGGVPYVRIGSRPVSFLKCQASSNKCLWAVPVKSAGLWEKTGPPCNSEGRC